MTGAEGLAVGDTGPSVNIVALHQVSGIEFLSLIDGDEISPSVDLLVEGRNGVGVETVVGIDGCIVSYVAEVFVVHIDQTDI